MTPSASVLTRFDCLDFHDLVGGGGRGIGPQHSCPLTFKFVPAGLTDKPVRDSLNVFLEFSR